MFYRGTKCVHFYMTRLIDKNNIYLYIYSYIFNMIFLILYAIQQIYSNTLQREDPIVRMPSIGPKTHYIGQTHYFGKPWYSYGSNAIYMLCNDMICKYYKFNAIYILILYNIRQIIVHYMYKILWCKY